MAKLKELKSHRAIAILLKGTAGFWDCNALFILISVHFLPEFNEAIWLPQQSVKK